MSGCSVSCSNITSTNKALVQTQDASDNYTAKICWPPPTDTPDNANPLIALRLNYTFIALLPAATLPAILRKIVSTRRRHFYSEMIAIKA
jgi:hypothetical protein